MLLEINMDKIDHNKDYEHEDCLNELLDLNCSYEMYYIEDNTKIFLIGDDELLDAYTYITDVFYLETDNLDLNDLNSLSKCIEIV